MSPRVLPSHPHVATRLFLRRLEAAGITDTKKLSASHWETIHALERGAVSSPVLSRRAP